MEPEPELELELQGKQSIEQNYLIIIGMGRKVCLKESLKVKKHMLFNFDEFYIFVYFESFLEEKKSL